MLFMFILWSSAVFWDVVFYFIDPIITTVMPVFAMTWSVYIWLVVKRLNLLPLPYPQTIDRIINDIQDIVILLDKEGNILMANPSFINTIGQSAGQIAGKKFDSVVLNKNQDFSMFLNWLFSPDLDIFNFEINLITENSLNLPYSFVCSRILNKRNEIMNTLLIGHDLQAMQVMESLNSQLERTLDKLKESNRDLHDFAFMASHDLREPLTVISGYIMLLRNYLDNKLGDDPEAAEILNFIADGSKRMNDLIDGILKFSRATSDEIQLSPVDMNQVLKTTLMDLSAAFEKYRPEIDYSEIPSVLGDKSQIGEVLQNLINNAIKYRDPDRPLKIKISSVRENTRIMICVEDNGMGIDPKNKELIFSMFRRLHSRDNIPGLGIGLSICKRIIERHGGRIWVESVPGEGSKFCFQLNSAEQDDTVA
jgi:signal transduction histidine kinase